MSQGFQYYTKSDSLKIIPHTILENFIAQIRIQKPHLEISIDSLQFVKAIKKDLEYDVNFSNFEDGNDSVDNYEQFMNLVYYKKKITSQIDVIKWVYIQVYDVQTHLHKTLKVQFLELYDNSTLSYQKELMSQKSKITQCHDNLPLLTQGDRSLMLKIYEYYFLSIAGQNNPVYFVVEQEYIHSGYQNHSKELLQDPQYYNLQQHQKKCLDYFLKQIGYVIDLRLLKAHACYYLTYNFHNSLSLGLSPIDFYPLFPKNNDDLNILAKVQFYGHYAVLEKENMMIIETNNDTIDTIQIDLGISCGCKEETFIQNLKKNSPKVFELHDTELIEILSQNPQLKNAELETYNKNAIQFRKIINRREFLLTCVRYENHFEAERLYAQFEQLLSFDLCHPESACEIIPLAGSITYLLFIEIDYSMYHLQNPIKFQTNKQKQVLFCWLINMLETISILKIETPILFDYHIGELEVENRKNEYQFFLKELFTFHHFFPTQSSLQMGRYFKFQNLVKNLFQQYYNWNYDTLFSQTFIHFLQQSKQMSTRKKITQYPILWKAYKAMSKLIQMEDAFYDSCEFSFDSSEIKLKNQSINLSQSSLQRLLTDYEIEINYNDSIIQTLQLLDSPTQVKIINIFSDNLNSPFFIDKFATVFANIEQLNLTVFVDQVFQVFNKLKLQNFKHLNKLSFNLTINNNYQMNNKNKNIKDLDILVINNFFETFKIKKFKIIDLDFKLLFPLIIHNSSDLKQEYCFTNKVTLEAKANNQIHVDENYSYTYNNIFLLFKQYGLQDQIQQIKEEFPQLLFEVIQNSSQLDNEILISISFVYWEQNEKNILFTIHFKTGSKNKSQRYDQQTISYEAKHQKRIFSQCQIPQKIENLYQLIKECVLFESYLKKMKMWFNHEDESLCEHCDFNEFIIQFYLLQANLQVLNINLRWCQQTMQLISLNNDYLRLNHFEQLYQINFNFSEGELTAESIQCLYNNLRKCRKAYSLRISNTQYEYTQPRKLLILFLKTPHIVKLEYINLNYSNCNFSY